MKYTSYTTSAAPLKLDKKLSRDIQTRLFRIGYDWIASTRKEPPRVIDLETLEKDGTIITPFKGIHLNVQKKIIDICMDVKYSHLASTVGYATSIQSLVEELELEFDLKTLPEGSQIPTL